MEQSEFTLWKKEDFQEPLIAIKFSKQHKFIREYLLSDKQNGFWSQFLASPYNSDISLSGWSQDYKLKNQRPCIRVARYIHVPKVRRPLAPEKVSINEKQELYVFDDKNLQIQITVSSEGVPFSDAFECQ